jgi:hypothetical protein
MPQVLVRQPGGFYCIVDDDLALVCAGECSIGNPILIGLCFRVGSRWRCLRLGLVDIGIEPSRSAAVDRIIADHDRAHVVTIDHETKTALPL